MFYIYSTIYNSYTAAGESVSGPGVFVFLGGVTTKGVSMASPVAGTELSLFISSCYSLLHNGIVVHQHLFL